MNNEFISKIIFYSISILIHIIIFYILAINIGLIISLKEEKQYEVLEFRLINPVVKTDLLPPPPEIKKSPIKKSPKVIDATTEITDEPEEEQESEEEVVQQLSSKIKKYAAFYKVDSRPSFKDKAPQRYPIIEKRAEKEGIVVLEADIDENGILQAIRILKSAGDNFDTSAREMIQNSTFNPGVKDGQTIPVRMRFTIRYKLKNS